MRKSKQWIFVGMGTQAFITASLTALGLINLTALHQTIVAVLIVHIIIGMIIVDAESPMTWIGMYFQTALSAITAHFGLVELNVINQVIFIGLYAAIILLIRLLQRIKKRKRLGKQ